MSRPWDPIKFGPDSEVCQYFEAMRAAARGEPGGWERWLRMQKEFEASPSNLHKILPGLESGKEGRSLMLHGAR